MKQYNDSSSTPRILSSEDCQAIIKNVLDASSGHGSLNVSISTWWNGELRWARNRIWDSNDRRNINVRITRQIGQNRGDVSVNQIDKLSIQAAVRFAESIASMDPSVARSEEMIPAPPILDKSDMLIWDEDTSHSQAKIRSDVATSLMKEAEVEGMMAAGYIESRAGAVAQLSLGSGYPVWEQGHRGVQYLRSLPRIPLTYQRLTQAQCSVTVRHPLGKGSGWAGSSSYSWDKVSTHDVARRALDKCISSLNPVRIEPGRYVVMLEPQAVEGLLKMLMMSFNRTLPEIRGRGPWVLGFDQALGMWRSKLGTKIIDERITISQSLSEPQLGYLSGPGTEDIKWIDNGVLKTLESERTDYLIPRLNSNASASGRLSYRMSGGNTSMEQMISDTQRGLVITRFSNISPIDGNTLLCTGITRDGLWLVEKGKITKPVQNMRFTESPLFVLNQIVSLGVPVPVFRPVTNENAIQLSPSIVPIVKANDFSFTSVNDAI